MSKLYNCIVVILLCCILWLSYENTLLISRSQTLQPQNEIFSSRSGKESAGQAAGGRVEQTVPAYRRGMYSWEDEPYAAPTKAELYATLEELQINELYQFISDPNLYSVDSKALATELVAMDIDLFYLTGDAEWGLDETGRYMIDAVNKVAAFNKVMGETGGFKGIVFDVEPFTTDMWDVDQDAVMQAFVPGMISAYNHAKAKGLRVIICIPNWYDIKHAQSLEALVSSACDEVAVMNYNRREEVVSVENEVRLAQKYEKSLSCIFEFQAPGNHELTDNETYYNDGLGLGLQNFETLYTYYGYNDLHFAYHYYKPVRELLL